MAALDFGMALARGMLPKETKAQEELLSLAGGKSVFKSEDWWNTQVDKQISKGYGKKETGTEYLTTSGEYAIGSRFERYGLYQTKPTVSYRPPRNAAILGYTEPRRNVPYSFPQPIYETRQVEVFGGQAGTEDFTAGQLKDIEKSAKAGAEQAKRTVAESKATRKRLSRATGGLMGKARQPGEAPVTGLPALGEGGLGIAGSILGGGIKL